MQTFILFALLALLTGSNAAGDDDDRMVDEHYNGLYFGVIAASSFILLGIAIITAQKAGFSTCTGQPKDDLLVEEEEV